MTARDTAAKFTVRLAQPSQHLSTADWKDWVAIEDGFGVCMCTLRGWFWYMCAPLEDGFGMCVHPERFGLSRTTHNIVGHV